jgi:acetyl esterase/lipase
MQRKHWKFCTAFWLMAAICSISAAKDTKQPETMRLWPGVAPGSENWKQPETALGSGDMEHLVNVTTPTLTAYLPDPSTATGTAVIIAPGGGFVFLGMNSEGHDVAKWLVTRGIAAFVLKYRTVQLEGHMKRS